MKVPLLDLRAQYAVIKQEVKQAVEEVLEEQQFILGERVAEFEGRMAEYVGISRAVGVASCTDGLLLSLMALGISPDNEIITTPFTFFSTAGIIARLNAKPVFMDIDPGSFNIDPDLVERKITPRTRAIIPVHLFGQCAPMDEITQIAEKHNLQVVEDAAQAIGASYKGRKAGSMGMVGCFSFYPSKNLGAMGDGGVVVTSKPELAERIRLLRNHGAESKYRYSTVGINSRLDALQAAILTVKLKYIDQWNRARRQNAENYTRLFRQANLAADEQGKMDDDPSNHIPVIIPAVLPECHHVFHQYAIRVRDRDRLKDYLAREGIGTAIYYPIPLHLQKCFSYLGYKQGELKNAERCAAECLSLPIYPELTPTQQEYVVEKIAAFFRKR
ncbi:transcriptional regulator [bacterium (candidate division B38) B3_B38]|nr:MAG: transcriptional regulator [bacterium (candidate division B38) B3_B38]